MRSDLEHQVAAREELLRALRTILIERTRVDRAPDEIDPDAPLLGLGLDSLDFVEFVINLDAMFGVMVEPLLARQQTRTLNTVVDLVLAHRSGHVR